MSSACTIDEPTADGEPTTDLEAPGWSKDGEELAVQLIKLAIERHLQENRVDPLIYHLTHNAFTEQARNSLIADLGHRPGPPQLLEMLAERFQYPEAILTLAKRHYTDPELSAAEFQAFLKKHSDNFWMLKSLIHLPRSSGEKEAVLAASLRQHEDLYHSYLDEQRSQQRRARAAIETGGEALQELFASRDPAVLRLLVKNPHTPSPLLQELASISNMKGAREIRELAKEALRRRSKTGKG